MAIDYRERRPGGTSTVNRPRRQGGGKAIFFIVLLVLVLGYCGGLATGWFLFRQAVPAALQAAQKKEAATQVQKAQAPVQARHSSLHGNTPLTFYDTLPKGKVILGTGLNPVRGEKGAGAPHQATAPDPQQSPAAVQQKPAPPAVPQVKKEAPPQPQQSKPAERQAAKPAAAEPPKTPASKGKYAVQLASYPTRKDADDLKNRLTAAGFAGYIVESEIAGKGKWYRVRVGRSLDVQAANELAARVGRGAMVILE